MFFIIEGKDFLKGTPLGLDLLQNCTEKTKILAKCIKTLKHDTDASEKNLEAELRRIVQYLQSFEQRIKQLEVSIAQLYIHN